VLKLVFASLALEHQWDGLGALGAAINLTRLEMWGEWVNFHVFLEVARASPGIHCLTVDDATLSVFDLERVATLAEFAHTCVVFHGTPADADESAVAGKLMQRQAKSVTEMIQLFAYSETSWTIAGVTRLLEHLRPGDKHEKHVKTFAEHLPQLDTADPQDFLPAIIERPVGGKQYRSHLFSTDESDDPHQWRLVLENWGDQLAVLLQYAGRPSTAASGADVTVTASMTITCTAKKKALYPGSSVRIQNGRFCRGDNIRVALLQMDSVPQDMIELRVLDVFVMETCRIAADCVDWRITGLNFLMDEPNMAVFSDVFKAMEADEPFQLSMQIPEHTIPDDAMFHADEAFFAANGVVDSGEDTAEDFEFDEKVAAVIDKAFALFENSDVLVAMAFATSCDSATRKYCHQTAARNSLEHSTRTDQDTQARAVWVFKTDRQDHAALSAYLRRCETPTRPNRSYSAALRIEHETTHRNTSQCLGHIWMDASSMVAENTSSSSVGCELAYRRELQRGDRSEVVHVKVLFVPDATCAPPRSVGTRWVPDDKERPWIMELLRNQATLKHQHSSIGAAARRLLISPDEMLLPEELLVTMVSMMEECTAAAGAVLLAEGAPCDEFLLLLDGSCIVAGGAEMSGQVALSRLVDTALGLGVCNRQTILAKDEVRYLRLDWASLLQERFAAAPPVIFPPPAYEVLSRSASAGSSDTTTWEWTLHRPAELLAAPAFAPIASAWFSIDSAPLANWRLHLIPIPDAPAASVRTAPAVALYLGCTRTTTMTTTQQMRALFSTSLLRGPGGSDTELQHGNLQRGEHEDRHLARELAHTSPGERLWGGAQITWDDLVADAPTVLRLALAVPVARESGFGLQATARSLMVAKRGLGIGSLPTSSAMQRGGAAALPAGGGGSQDQIVVEETNEMANPLAQGQAKPGGEEDGAWDDT
jgi:hypothetical protein